MENICLAESLRQKESIDTLPVQRQILAQSISRCNHDSPIDDDERIGIQSRCRRPTSNIVIHGRNENDYDYYGSVKSKPPSNRNHVYMNDPTKSYPYERVNPNTDKAYEVE